MSVVSVGVLKCAKVSVEECEVRRGIRNRMRFKNVDKFEVERIEE